MQETGPGERTRRSAKNAVVALASQLAVVAAGFISRKVFVDTLGFEVLGVNGLLTSIISMLSLSELGVGTAVICALYKPLAQRNELKIISIVRLYAKACRVVAAIIFALGLAAAPFLDMLLKNGMGQAFLSAVFALFLLDTVIPYLFAHKRALLFADQRNYVLTLASASASVAASAAQIAALLLTRNYILFLGIRAAFRLAENFFVSAAAKRRYPFLSRVRNVHAEPSVKREIISSTKSLSLHYLGIYLINGTDNLIISGFLGIAAVGVYSNYYLVIATLTGFLSQIQTAVVASFGNLTATESSDKTLAAFKNANFLNFLICNFAAVSLLCLLGPFVALWVGSTGLLGMGVVLIVILNFYVSGVSGVLGALRAGAGVFRPDRYLHLLLAALNLAVSISFVQLIGMAGVFLGTLLCLIIKEVSVLPRIVYSKILNAPVKDYYQTLSRYLLITLMSAVLTYFACEWAAPAGGIASFLLRCAFCLVIPNALALALLFKTGEFAYAKSLAASAAAKAGLHKNR